jgi:HTH-like domain
VSRFRFIAAEKANHQVATLCRLLGVSRSGFYAWSLRPPSHRSVLDAEITREIVHAHGASRGTYGAPRIHAELRYAGRSVGRKRVARLIRALTYRERGPRRGSGSRTAGATVHRGRSGPSLGGDIWRNDPSQHSQPVTGTSAGTICISPAGSDASA